MRPSIARTRALFLSALLGALSIAFAGPDSSPASAIAPSFTPSSDLSSAAQSITARDQEFAAQLVARLALASEVAWTKHQRGLPVHDPVREAQILVSVVKQGRELGLDPARVEAIFSAQFAASRQVQQELIAGWNEGKERPGHEPLDLPGKIRPRLDTITAAMLAAFPSGPDQTLADHTARQLENAGFSPTAIALAVAPLRPASP